MLASLPEPSPAEAELQAQGFTSTTTPPTTTTTTTTDQKANNANTIKLALSVLAVVISGIGNRLLYKMALKPLGNYVFFLAQLQTFGYVIVYFAVLALRWRAGKVSAAMLAVPRRMLSTFIAIGFIEALSSLLSFVSAANLPGVVLPLLSQTVLFWQVLLAHTLLKKRLGGVQVGGVGLVVTGVALAAWPSSKTTSILANVSPVYAIIFVISMLFPALDTILKETVFRTWREENSSSSTTKGDKRDLDLFVINSFGSLCQALFVFALLPAITAARGMNVADLPAYLAAGWQCVQGITPPCGSNCTGAPLIPVLYVAFNLLFNVAALQVIRQAGNVAISLVMSAIVPLTLFAFTLPLPYLDPAPALGVGFFVGTGILMVGLGAYNGPMWVPVVKKWIEQKYSMGVVAPKGGNDSDSNGGGAVAAVVSR